MIETFQVALLALEARSTKSLKGIPRGKARTWFRVLVQVLDTK